MFDDRWNRIHAERPWGKYPDEHLVRAFARRFGLVNDRDEREPKLNALDIGCGAGAQTLFLIDEGCEVVAVDAAKPALEHLAVRISRGSLADHVALFCGELADVNFSPDQWDVAVDVCTLQHLEEAEATKFIERLRGAMKPGGWFFSVMASKGHAALPDVLNPRRVGLEDLPRLFKGWHITTESVSRTAGDKLIAHRIIEATPA